MIVIGTLIGTSTGAVVVASIGSLFVVLSVLLLVRRFGHLVRAQSASRRGLAPSSYILLSLCLWIAESNVFTRLQHEGRAMAGVLWSLFTFWWPPEVLSHWSSFFSPSPDRSLMVIIAALGIAIALSILRLRNADLPTWIAPLALVPFVNLALFVFLSVAPTRTPGVQRRTWADYLLPRDELGSAVVACIAAAALGLGLTQLGTVSFGSYGWTLFTLVPLTMGFVGALIFGASEPRSSTSCLSVAVTSVVIGGLTLMGFAIEGAICVLMAAPLAIPLAGLGGWLGYLVQRRPNISSQTPQIAGALLLFVPFMMFGEQRSRTDARQIAVSTSIVIHAPADRVWTSVIRLASVPKPNSPLFDSVAYPIKTTLEGTGVGARRQCVFSTGSIVEPIEVWTRGKELRFAVVSQPALMHELTPYADVHPPHLKLEYLRSREGQFTLSARPDGTTLLTGTSYYESRLWPGAYWQIWSNEIAHMVHRVVLAEIKRQAEM